MALSSTVVTSLSLSFLILKVGIRMPRSTGSGVADWLLEEMGSEREDWEGLGSCRLPKTVPKIT